MATNYNIFTFLKGTQVYGAALLDISNEYLFRDSGSDRNTASFTQKFKPPGGGTSIMEQFREIYQEEVDAHFATSSGAFVGDELPVLTADATIDQHRALQLIVNKETQPSKPTNFERMGSASLRLSEGTITVPHELVQEPDWGATFYRWQIRTLVRANPNGPWQECLRLDGYIRASLTYKPTNSVFESNISGYCYYNIETGKFCRITHEGDQGNYQQLAALLIPGTAFAPEYTPTVYAYYYLRNSYTPRPGLSTNYDYTWLYGNSVYDPSIYEFGPLGTKSETDPGPGPSPNPGGSTGIGSETSDIPTGSTGWRPSDPNTNIAPGYNVTTLDKGTDGKFGDSYGSGMAGIGEFSGEGGYVLVGMTTAQLGYMLGTITSASIEDALLDKFRNLFGSFVDSVLTCRLYPFTVSGGSGTLTFGGSLAAGSASRLPSQYYTADFGSVLVERPWNNYLDYECTTVSIYIPFVGWQPLKTSDVMGRNVQLTYNVDLVSGTFTAALRVYYNGTPSLDATLYEWSGTMGFSIPITPGGSEGYLRTGAAMASLAALAAVGAAGAASGVSLPTVTTGYNLASPEPAQKILSDGTAAVPVPRLTQEMQEVRSEAIQTTPAPAENGKAMTWTDSPGVAATIGAAVGHLTATDVGRGTALPDVGGYLADLVPKILIDAPIPLEPDGYAHYYGRPSMVTTELFHLVGYVQVSSWECNVPGATASEIAEIDRLLKGGIWV